MARDGYLGAGPSGKVNINKRKEASTQKTKWRLLDVLYLKKNPGCYLHGAHCSIQKKFIIQKDKMPEWMFRSQEHPQPMVQTIKWFWILPPGTTNQHQPDCQHLCVDQRPGAPRQTRRQQWPHKVGYFCRTSSDHDHKTRWLTKSLWISLDSPRLWRGCVLQLSKAELWPRTWRDAFMAFPSRFISELM